MTATDKLAEIIKKYNRHPQFLGLNITDVNQPGAVDDTLLHIAASKGELDDVKVLVACGAKVNAIGDMGGTPLHDAASAGRVEVVAFLLANGADPSIRNEFGKTAADWAKAENHIDVLHLLQKHRPKRTGHD